MSRKTKPKSRPQGSIETRGASQYRAAIVLNGVRHRDTFSSPASAEKWLDFLIKAHAGPKDRLTLLEEASRKTLGEAFEDRLEHIAEHKTISKEKTETERLKRDYPQLMGKLIFNIDEIDINEFISHRREFVGPATVNRDLNRISSAFQYARTKHGCVGLGNPIGPTTRLSEPPGRIRRLHPDEGALLHRLSMRIAADELASDSVEEEVRSFIGDLFQRY